MLIRSISLYLVIGIMFLAFLSVHSFSKSKSNYARALGLLSIAIQIYMFGYLMEINVATLEQMLFWNQIQYFGIPFFPGFWFMVSLLYTGRGNQMRGLKWALVFAIPMISFIARLTNPLHHLYYSSIELVRIADANLMLLGKGPLYVVQMIYVLVTLLLCTWYYFQRYRLSKGYERIQFKLLLIASVLPYVALVLVALNMGGTGIDFTAIILPPCVLLINVALTRYNFLVMKALARERVFEDSSSGLVLLNRFYHVVDYNASSITFFKWLGVGLKLDTLESLLKGKPEVYEAILKQNDQIVRVTLDGSEKCISVTVRHFHNKNELTGMLVTLEDVTEREVLKRQLIEMANTDALSGLHNRRYFSEHAFELFNRARRYNEPLSFLMMDIDYFKKINDTYGHQVGDDVIRAFSTLLTETFRGTDEIGRMGGEEFAVIMIHSDAENAYEKAERFRKMVESHAMAFGGQTFSITVSIGIAALSEKTGSVDALMGQADNCLYDAKKTGRNRTVVL